jgi:hypothetical protein
VAQEAPTINTENEKTIPGDTEEENNMNMGDRQINHEFNPTMCLPLTLQKFAADHAASRRSAGDGPWAGQRDKGQKIPEPVHKLLITMHLPKNEAKRT